MQQSGAFLAGRVSLPGGNSTGRQVSLPQLRDQRE